MKNNSKKNLSLLLLTMQINLSACSGLSSNHMATPELSNAPVPPVSGQSSQNVDTERTESGENKPPANTPAVAGDDEKENRYLYSFVRSNPNDPAGMINFGINQTTQINQSISSAGSVPFQIETELDAMAMSTETFQQKFAELREKLKPQDTFVLYTHSHGLIPGLGLNWNASNRFDIPFSWRLFAQEILSLPAKNVIVFTMSCHSGYLTEALNSLSSEWKNKRKSAGRNLIVLTAVSKEQLAKATDQGTTSDSLGNPFTYAVKTAIKGAADGFGGQTKDGKTQLSELVGYVLSVAKSKSLDAYADPQIAGEYNEDEVFLQ